MNEHTEEKDQNPSPDLNSPDQEKTQIIPDTSKTDQESESESQTSQKTASDEKDSSPKKKESKIGGWIIAAVCVLALTISVSLYMANPKKAAQAAEDRSITMLDVGFDTAITFQTKCTEEDFNKYLEIVRPTFIDCNALFDAVKESTVDGITSMYTINQEAHDHPVEVDSQVIELIRDSIEIHSINEKFDPSQGKLTALWRDALNKADENPGSDGVLPSDSDIQASINHLSMDGVEITDSTVELTDEAASLDFGAIAKGYAAELAAERLKEAGLDYGLINAGGNVVLIGEKPNGKPWKVGIQNPSGSNSLVIYTTEQPECLVTSGDYQRYMMVDGKRYNHIIDPTTGYPAEYMRSVTVIADDSTYADGMSTALFCMPVEEGMALCEQTGLKAVWIVDHGTLEKTPDLSTDDYDIYMTPDIKDQVSLKQQS